MLERKTIQIRNDLIKIFTLSMVRREELVTWNVKKQNSMHRSCFENISWRFIFVEFQRSKWKRGLQLLGNFLISMGAKGHGGAKSPVVTMIKSPDLPTGRSLLESHLCEGHIFVVSCAVPR